MNWYFQNLFAGIKYALFERNVDQRSFHISWHSLVAIILTYIAVHWLIDAVLFGKDKELQLYSWYEFHACMFLFVFMASYASSAINNRISLILDNAVIFYHAYFPVYIVYFLLESISPDWYSEKAYYAFNNLILIFVFLITFRIICTLFTPKTWQLLSSCIVTVLAIYALNDNVYISHFYDNYDYSNEDSKEFAEYRKLTAEEQFASQTALLDEKLKVLKPSKSGVTDIYGISFGSYGYQDVFMREANYVAGRMKDVLGIDKGIITMINNPETYTDVPFANSTNLRYALEKIKENMQSNEDVLLFYLTSHGSEENGLSVNMQYGPGMKDLDPEFFAELMDKSGIKNRVFIISACHSGVFIPHLQNDNTMIITAAANNKQSYGCSDDADLTYFAQAYFKEALEETTDLAKAYELAREKVALREKNEGLKSPSNPQIFIGKEIKNALLKYKSKTLISKDTPITQVKPQETSDFILNKPEN